jgi:hypothetical protein
MTVHVIDRYEVSMWSSRPMTPGAPVVGIWLYGPADALGYAYFFLDSTQLQPPLINQGFIALHYNLALFGPILQILREESPVYLYEFGASNAGLKTGTEPTGEEEGLGG